ncbi:SPOR domain-containing protein [Chlorobium phaeovibrioides]|uniref:SPOR domain-containing protein n=1 Tax=Chlorobium phaeovibrioides TaxID=1094 RepID=A0ABW9ULL1_CHLPH|nr:SPOR domain-containing protein [Chlorobium phaeovibrioides]MWV53950.1 SPOR domain-containing protein [Chlorobium phaeovibrioides]
MHTSHSLLKFRPGLFLLLLMTIFLSPSSAHSAGALSFSRLITQAVNEDKIYLLETIRQKATINSEKTVIEALLTKDGPKAAELFKKQLTLYPDPAMDAISKARLTDYKTALAAEPPLPKLSKPLPARTLAPPAHTAQAAGPAVQMTPLQSALESLKKNASSDAGQSRKGFTLQFGSFGSRTNAEALAARIAPYSPVVIVPENQMHKVRLNSSFGSEKEAKQAGKAIPFGSIVLPASR